VCTVRCLFPQTLLYFFSQGRTSRRRPAGPKTPQRQQT
jgi:hypothetical protein